MPDAPVAHHHVAVQGVRLHVVTAGPPSGPPVLLLHGFPEYWGGWRRQIGPLSEAGYRLIVPDQRGYAGSDKPPRVADHRIDILARDAVGLLDHFGAERAHVLCHDWGGAVGWWLAQHHAERVDRFCVLDMPHLGVMLRHLRGPRQLARSWYIGLFQLPWLPESLLLANDCARLVQLMVGNTRHKPFTPEEIAAYKVAWTTPGAIRGNLAWYRAIARRPPLRRSQARVTRPTKILWGRHDRALSWRMAADSAAMCDDAQVVILDDAGHFVQHDAPDRVNAEVLDFFAAGASLLEGS